jgi:hypothetical protein
MFVCLFGFRCTVPCPVFQDAKLNRWFPKSAVKINKFRYFNDPQFWLCFLLSFYWINTYYKH